jgi:hypothetical protein
MTLDDFNKNDSVRSSYDLCQEADRMLQETGCDIWGNEKARESYLQAKFERSMITGAFRNNSERGGRGRR